MQVWQDVNNVAVEYHGIFGSLGIRCAANSTPDINTPPLARICFADASIPLHTVIIFTNTIWSFNKPCAAVKREKPYTPGFFNFFINNTRSRCVKKHIGEKYFPFFSFAATSSATIIFPFVIHLCKNFDALNSC